MSSTRSPDGDLANRIDQYQQTARKIRRDIIEMCHAAQSGHPGGSLSAVEYLLWLYGEELEIDPDAPDDPGRDRLIYSKGHACPVLYAVLRHRGFLDVELNEEFRQFKGALPGHSSPKVPGVEFPSGSLGQGLSYANGLALAADLDELDYQVYSVHGDGELQEGQIWEAAMTAGDKGLGNLTAIIDHNRKQNDLPISETMEVEPIAEKFESFGWHVWQCDGHDFNELANTFADIRADASDRPCLLIADTVKGKGVSFMEETPNGYHAGAPTEEELQRALGELGFEIKHDQEE